MFLSKKVGMCIYFTGIVKDLEGIVVLKKKLKDLLNGGKGVDPRALWEYLTLTLPSTNMIVSILGALFIPLFFVTEFSRNNRKWRIITHVAMFFFPVILMEILSFFLSIFIQSGPRAFLVGAAIQIALAVLSNLLSISFFSLIALSAKRQSMTESLNKTVKVLEEISNVTEGQKVIKDSLVELHKDCESLTEGVHGILGLRRRLDSFLRKLETKMRMNELNGTL